MLRLRTILRCLTLILSSLCVTVGSNWIGCQSAPISGRQQLLLVPESEEIALGVSAYQDILRSEPLSRNLLQTEMVRRVGTRIAQVANRPDYQWEFQLIASPTQNAFALPGGKVAIYEGILPICENEAGLAVVMSHEIAHALARHGGERMSHDVVVRGVGNSIDYWTKGQDAVRQRQIQQAFGLSSRYGFVLPYSRKHESEADRIGMILMARAGYDPSEAPRFWQRFGSANGGVALPEFLSTHPSDARRAADLQAVLPVAMAEYQLASSKFGAGNPIPLATQ